MFHRFVVCAFFSVVASVCGAAEKPSGKIYENFIGIKFVRIEPGQFRMGFQGKPLQDKLLSRKGTFADGDFDEHPAHPVRISEPFYMGMYEVTNAQYERFDSAHKEFRGRFGYSQADNEAVLFVSWKEAAGFCRWLSKKEKLPYRLPTEAEWEYACRAGSSSPFYTGDVLPEGFVKGPKDSLSVGKSPPNKWGLYDMHGNVEEWCRDWYGPYDRRLQVDPVGRVGGEFKVTRGGSHSTVAYYLRSANRSGTIPQDKHWLIGFRVVIAEPPDSEPLPLPESPRVQRDVGQEVPADIQKAPDKSKPYFKGPRLFIQIGDDAEGPLFSEHNHFTALTECDNGDLLAAWFTCISEGTRELAIAASRLRYGNEQWDEASPFWDAPDRNDHTNAFWNDGRGTLYHFNGLGVIKRSLAMVLRKSKDNGRTWSKAQFVFSEHGVRANKVVESVFRAQDGRVIVPFDGRGGSVIAISRDEGKTWTDPGGNIRGTHAGVVQLRDGRLLAFGRHGAIDGKMPQSISSDMGKSWSYRASDFQPIHAGRRVALMRLKQGPLFFASFCNNMKIKDFTGKERPVSGLFAAVSMDEGKTWPYRRLVTDDGQGRFIETMDGDPIIMDRRNAEPVGYLSVCQTPDGVIQLLTSRQHYAFNLAWLKTLPASAPPGPPAPKARELSVKGELPEVYEPQDLPTDSPWQWNYRGPPDESDVVSVSKKGLLEIDTVSKGQFWLRTEKLDLFGKVVPEEGFSSEIRTRVLEDSTGRGVDFELYDGAGSRYAVTITKSGVYWYNGTVISSAFLPFEQYEPVAQGLNNSDKMHTYRLAVRSDKVVQIYRDGKLLGTYKKLYRTPRYPYIYLGAGRDVRGQVDYVSFDLAGAFKPE